MRSLAFIFVGLLSVLAGSAYAQEGYVAAQNFFNFSAAPLSSLSILPQNQVLKGECVVPAGIFSEPYVRAATFQFTWDAGNAVRPAQSWLTIDAVGLNYPQKHYRLNESFGEIVGTIDNGYFSGAYLRGTTILQNGQSKNIWIVQMPGAVGPGGMSGISYSYLAYCYTI